MFGSQGRVSGLNRQSRAEGAIIMQIQEWLKENSLLMIDIGASGGIHPRWKKFVPHLKAVLFEPDPREFDRLRSTAGGQSIVLNSAVSDVRGEIDFHLCRKQQVSSIYKPDFDVLRRFPDSERFEILRTIKIPVDTLDHLLEQNKIIDVDVIKIDTEGQELPILRRSKNTLQNVIGLELEVGFLSIRHNQPVFSELDTFVTAAGFELFDLKRYFWKRKDDQGYGCGKGQISVGEALYFRTPETICSLRGISAAKIIRAISVYLAYGYFDLAETLCSLANTNGILSTEISKDIMIILARLKKNKLPDFWGKRYVYKFLRKAADLFCTGAWYSGGDEFLGNK